MADLELWIATRKGLFTIRSDDDWRLSPPAFLGDSVTFVLPDSRCQVVYAALRLGHFGAKLWRSRNGGESWEETGAPVYPMSGTDASLQQIWSIAERYPDRPGTLWAGTIPGGLFESSDWGESWLLVESLWNRPERSDWFGGGYDDPGIHSICVHPDDPERVSIGISCGGVWSTSDGGASWMVSGPGMRADYVPPSRAFDPNIQDPHLLAQCRSRPDHLWVQHHNGIFKSSDRASSWTEIERAAVSGFGFAVAAHPLDPMTAWFAPAVQDETRVPVDARLVVTRTRDGGKSFEILSEGLPNTPAYDLIYRHCLVVDSSGKILALASTTGGLWISDDAGDTWTRITTHLPPVYSLAFRDRRP